MSKVSAESLKQKERNDERFMSENNFFDDGICLFALYVVDVDYTMRLHAHSFCCVEELKRLKARQQV